MQLGSWLYFFSRGKNWTATKFGLSREIIVPLRDQLRPQSVRNKDSQLEGFITGKRRFLLTAPEIT